MKLAVLLMILGLSACAADHPLPMPEGGWHRLNADKWTFQDNTLTGIPPGQGAVR